MTVVKYGAFIAALVIMLFAHLNKILQRNIIILFSFAALLNIISFILNGSSDQALYQAITFLAPMAWILAIHCLNQNQIQKFKRIIEIPLAIIGVAVLYALLAKFSLVENFQTPIGNLELDNHQFEGYGRLSVSASGFNFGRTGWGTGTGMALVLLASLLIARDRFWTGVTVLILAILAPAAMGARGAALSAIAAFIVAISISRISLYIKVCIAVALIVLLPLSLDYFWLSGLISERFFNFQAHGDLFTVIDEATTARLTTWVHGFSNFIFNPVIGVGVEESRVILQTGEVVGIHNVWIGFLSEGGLLAFVPAVSIFIYCIMRVWPHHEYRALVVFSGVLSLFEPSVIFGTFGNQVPFWTAVGLSLRAAKL